MWLAYKVKNNLSWKAGECQAFSVTVLGYRYGLQTRYKKEIIVIDFFHVSCNPEIWVSIR